MNRAQLQYQTKPLDRSGAVFDKADLFSNLRPSLSDKFMCVLLNQRHNIVTDFLFYCTVMIISGSSALSNLGQSRKAVIYCSLQTHELSLICAELKHRCTSFCKKPIKGHTNIYQVNVNSAYIDLHL